MQNPQIIDILAEGFIYVNVYKNIKNNTLAKKIIINF